MIPLGIALPLIAALFLLLVRREVARADRGTHEADLPTWERRATVALITAVALVIATRLTDVVS